MLQTNNLGVDNEDYPHENELHVEVAVREHRIIALT
jgi:hypothetical protein